jgi:uncharacterized membrane protein
MRLGNLFEFGSWVLLIEFVGALLIVSYALAATVAVLRFEGIDRARFLVADGVLAGLNFKLAATVLKIVLLRSWEQILLFVVIIFLRTLLKQLFRWERGRLEKGTEAPED